MRVAVVAEFYPREGDPVLGVWAHRQALAARAAGADVQVMVLHRLVPSRAAAARGPRASLGELARLLAQPLRQRRDGLTIHYVPFVSGPRASHYAAWGAWAAPPLAVALRALRRSFAFDLIHAHNAVPAGDAVRRARIDVPCVVSVHGGDVLFTAPLVPGGAPAVRAGLEAARLVLANSAGIERLARAHGAGVTRVVHPGADLESSVGRAGAPASGASWTLVTVGHLVGRKRHDDVVRAVALLGERHPRLRYRVVGDGPELEPLRRLAAELGVADRVTLLGARPPAAALRELRDACLFVMPSIDEAFGVAYVEAMAAGVPALGCEHEPGPRDIAAAGPGLELVASRDPVALATRIDALLTDRTALARLSAGARETVARRFTWEHCGRDTVAAYAAALR